MLWALIEQFWPIIAAAGVVLAGWLGLKAKAASDRKVGRAEAMREQETQGAQARRKADDEVARATDDDRTRELQSWER